MEITLKKLEVLELMSALGSLKDFDWNKNPKAVYNIVKNKKLLSNEQESIMEAVKTPAGLQEDMKKYDEKLGSLWKECADKDESGEPVLNPNALPKHNPYVITKELTKLNKEVRKLEEEFGIQAKIVAWDKQVNDLLQEKVTVNIHQMVLDDSFKGVTQKQMEALSPIIKES